ncbi:hypothetical protein GCM10010156_37040 [Planobispora rosea]|nr:SMI1/KNR4 family protein [Planobispora rosea]GGS74835.1 hypothetical protein GCM10010156_37040 [Planobispora rosea]
MIKLSGARTVRPALALVVLAGGAAASSPMPYEFGRCFSMSVGNSVSMSCVDAAGAPDPEAEAELRAHALTPEQARAAGCEPVEWDDGSEPSPAEPEIVTTDEPEPTPSPRTPDPAVTARVNRAWDRIERWLGTHASATLRKLGHPAEPEDLATWEGNGRNRLPDGLYASLLRHDGADGDFGEGFQLPPSHGLADVYSHFRMQESNCRDLVMTGPPEAADPDHGKWHGSLWPFAADGEGRELFVDPRTGRVGEKVWDGNVRYDGPMGWPSYPDLLEAVAASLEGGTALRDWYPTVTPGCELRWADEPADTLPTGCAGGPRPSPTPTPTEEPEPERPTDEEIRASGCRPDRRPPVVRTPDPAVTAKVDAVWRRIERWLARRAPVTYRTLYGPARPGEIAKVEAAMGMRFPDDLRASLLRHNGARYWGGFGPPPFYEYMSAKALYREWKMLCGIVLDGPGEMIGYWWDGHLLPFATTIDGGNMFIDTRTGKTGDYFNETGLNMEGDVVWPSYYALLKATAAALESGRPVRGWRPAVRKGELDWEPVEDAPAARD